MARQAQDHEIILLTPKTRWAIFSGQEPLTSTFQLFLNKLVSEIGPQNLLVAIFYNKWVKETFSEKQHGSGSHSDEDLWSMQLSFCVRQKGLPQVHQPEPQSCSSELQKEGHLHSKFSNLKSFLCNMSHMLISNRTSQEKRVFVNLLLSRSFHNPSCLLPEAALGHPPLRMEMGACRFLWWCWAQHVAVLYNGLGLSIFSFPLGKINERLRTENMPEKTRCVACSCTKLLHPHRGLSLAFTIACWQMKLSKFGAWE